MIGSGAAAFSAAIAARRITGVEAEHYVIATGSAPFVPSIPGLAESGYLTSTTAMELDELTDSLIVVGGGYVGLELAQLFARLGTRVSVVETVDGLAQARSRKPASSSSRCSPRRTFEVHTGVIVTNVTRQGPTVLTTLRHPEARSDQLNGQQLLVAAGAARSPTR